MAIGSIQVFVAQIRSQPQTRIYPKDAIYPKGAIKSGAVETNKTINSATSDAATASASQTKASTAVASVDGPAISAVSSTEVEPLNVATARTLSWTPSIVDPSLLWQAQLYASSVVD